MKKLLALFLLAPLSLVLASCGPKNPVSQKIGEQMAEKAIEAQTGAKVDINSQGRDVTVKTEDGTSQYSATGEASLPDGFPKELIVVGDAKVIMATTSDKSSTVAYATNEEQNNVFEDYKNKLVSATWTKEMEADTGDGKLLSFAKGTDKVTITIGENSSEVDKGKTMVYVMLVKE